MKIGHFVGTKNVNVRFGSTNIVNGRVVDGSASNFTKIDKRNTIDESSAKHIIINGTACDISITESATSNFSAHLHGECSFVNGSVPTLSVTETSEEIRVDVKCQSNSFSGKLSLKIDVPSGRLYRSIAITTQYGDISVDNSIKAEYLRVESQCGNITIGNKICKNLDISTMSGSIDAEIIANEDVSLSFKTMSGDIDIKLSNVKVLNFEPSIISGSIRNNFFNSDGGYVAKVSASTMSGGIYIS